jgi:hypothetical protein
MLANISSVSYLGAHPSILPLSARHREFEPNAAVPFGKYFRSSTGVNELGLDVALLPRARSTVPMVLLIEARVCSPLEPK